MRKNFVSTVAGASLILSIVALLGKGIGFVREIIYANKFGLSTDYEIFLVGAAVPIFLNTAIIYLTQNFFIPAYNQALKKSYADAIEFFNFSFWWLVSISVLISILLALLSNPTVSLFVGSASSAFKEDGINIFLLFLITIPANTVISVITAKMQADFKFIYPAVIQIVLNVVIIILILIFTNLLRIYVLPMSFVAAYFISALLLLRRSAKEIKFNYKTMMNKDKISSNYKTFLFLLLIEVLSLSYMLLDRYFYDIVPVGGIAALNYAIVIFALPISIISLPFVTTVFSKFSQNSQFAQELNKNDFNFALTINNFLMVPISFLLFFGGETFLRIFYEHGQFTAESTRITASTLNYYTIGLVLYSSYLIIVKYLYSVQLVSKVLYISIAAFLLKLTFNFLFVNHFKHDGLALSTSIVYIISFLIGFYLIDLGKRSSEKIFYLKSLVYFLLNSLTSLLLTHIVFYIIDLQHLYKNILAFIFFIGFYLLYSNLLNDKEYNVVQETISKFLLRLKLKFES